ncbi:MAG: polysaccharide pyruvyl transferase family protein [Gammaproteobacteria bacterium]|nr:polysaccharide pyruvyl transferase family protein [Gammaproteobacteria bacterium]MDH3465116.1 polysaccharide pyruvyl transferase family protein [Gammaproteobacteria bacterium]
MNGARLERLIELKVGILTYHYVYNEGALWQAYVLCKTLREQLKEAIVEIIDYRYEPKTSVINSRISAERRDKYESFIKDYLSEETIISDNCLRLNQLINEEYQAVIVGSDIIWQFEIRSSCWNEYCYAIYNSPFRPDWSTPYRTLRSAKNWVVNLLKKVEADRMIKLPVPNAYWLSQGCDCLRISYAASIGYSNSNIPEKQKKWMSETLSRFDLISVRDENTKTFLCNVDNSIGKRALKVPDPAWLFGDDLPDGEEILQLEGLNLKGPIAGVLYPLGNRYGQMLDKFLPDALRMLGFQVVSVIDSNPNVDCNLASNTRSIFEWWAIVRRLDFFVTVRTHPNIAALMYQTPFINLDITAALKQSESSKSSDMLAEFGLSHLCLFKDRDLNEQSIVGLINSTIRHEWDWKNVEREIWRKRHVAADYIASIRKLVYADHI